MELLGSIIQLFDMKMVTPEMYGGFHMMSLVLTVLVTIFICTLGKNMTSKQVIGVVFGTAVMVILFEIYKQINFTFSYDGEKITADYMWYAFPWQFCSTPMYVGFLAGIFRKGKLHDALCAFLATYAIFAGVCVMVYPSSVFIETIGINIQTMVCHGSMIVIGVFLLYTGHVKLEHRTILKAMPVFAVAVSIATIMNEVAYRTGLLETDEFNMFFISPYCAPSLPVYSMVQEVVPFPFCLIIYISIFSMAAYIVLLCSMGICKIAQMIKMTKRTKLVAVSR